MNSSQTFDGTTFKPQFDLNRLTRQIDKVKTLMMDGKWRTLSEIGDETCYPEASISARLRDLRKERFGGYSVEHRRCVNQMRGIWEYRMVL